MSGGQADLTVAAGDSRHHEHPSPKIDLSSPLEAADLDKMLRAGWRLLLGQAKDKTAAPLPVSLRPFAKFRRPPSVQLMTAIERDDSLRQRLSEELSKEMCGEAGWLWLTRPEGWEDELASLLDMRRSSGIAKGRVTRAQEVLKGLLRKIEKSDRKADAASKSVRKAEADLRDKERSAHDAQVRLNEADAAHKKAEAEKQLAAKRQRSVDSAVSAARSRLHEARQKEAAVRSGLDRMVDQVVALEGTEQKGAQTDTLCMAGTATATKKDSAAPSKPVHRHEVLLVVDGYNMVLPLDSDQEELSEARARLERHLNDYAAVNIRQRVMVVWDGDQDPYSAQPQYRDGPQVGAAEVRFSPVGSSADDSIVEICRDPPGGLPVTVVSDDKGLAERVRACGATALGRVGSGLRV